ncbi:MAG: hypothetical protein ACUVRO_05900, partial [Armatimonadota bacterium]
VYASSEWDEAGRCVGAYKDAKTNQKLFKENNGGEHKAWGWGTAGKAVAADGMYLYVVNTEGNLLRFRRADQRYLDGVKVGKAVDMTCHSGYLYIVLENGEVQVRRAEDRALVRSFRVQGAADIAVDGRGRIWLRIGKQVRAYTQDGTPTSTAISGLEAPSDIAIDNRGRLIVCDNGFRSQVLFYDVSSAPRLAAAFGRKGGLRAGIPGLVKGDPTKLFSIRGAGTDATGNLYVAMSDGWSIIRKFTPAGKLVWEVQSLFFVDGASFDPASDGRVIYGREEIIEYDYAKQAWMLRAITRDPAKGPSDPRKNGAGMGWIRRVRGHRLLFIAGQYGGEMPVLYFDPRKNSELAMDSGLRLGKGWAIWPDKNGSVWYCNEDRIVMEPLTGFRPDGRPIYGKPKTYPRPAEFVSVERIVYDANHDVMYLAGFTKENPDPGGAWGLVGTEIIRYDNWSTGPKLRMRIRLPFKTWEGGGPAEMVMPKSIAVAGDYVFVVYVWNLEGEGNKPPVRVYRADTGRFVGELRPGGVIGTAHGWVDVPYGIDAVRRSNGEYVLLVEEDYRAKIVLYRWRP